ncbi:hypothetical protein [Phenylobacterium soli]|uniref:DUF465 domain-containing protein n=1 Tax=Phenylobacterium soli TaxID=2170551 RepID=A0A328ABD6_9CAUL|nr:hypothetical protein [Phenylobacterium soli]RAK51767.1 hypothetical protein DJ017_18230 [Phenylobacterium soli]
MAKADRELYEELLGARAGLERQLHLLRNPMNSKDYNAPLIASLATQLSEVERALKELDDER